MISILAVVVSVGSIVLFSYGIAQGSPTNQTKWNAFKPSSVGRQLVGAVTWKDVSCSDPEWDALRPFTRLHSCSVVLKLEVVPLGYDG